jgi:hypothetical protein
MSDYSGAAEGAKTAIAVAPGVWVRDSPGASVRENADSGSLFGWCASVKTFEAHAHEDRGSTCW